MSASHDIIDGQQRLTTLYELLDDPMIYVRDWQSKPPPAAEPEPSVAAELRDLYDDLIDTLYPVSAGYRTQAMRKPELRQKVAADMVTFAALKPQDPIPDGRFTAAVEKLREFVTSISQRNIVIQELIDVGTADAERMYKVINTSGTELLWWELARAHDPYMKKPYSSPHGYVVTHASQVKRLAALYQGNPKIKSYSTGHDTFWDAFFAVGEYYQLLFAKQSPQNATKLVQSDERRLKVDGLGYRLVSAFLSHEVSRVAINNLGTNYSDDNVRQAIDSLFDTGAILFQSAPKFSLFKKYASFQTDVLPSYPILGIIVAAAKMVAYNKAVNAGKTLTQNDTLNLRCLTEEIFREALTTTKWSGSGDSKLKEWLDSHFEPVQKLTPPQPGKPAVGLPFPGALKGAASTHSSAEWGQLIDSLKPMNQRGVDRSSMTLHFWLQYIADSNVAGTLPQGTVQYDHIVPHQLTPNTPTSDPMNYVAIPTALNKLKAKKSYSAWAASASNADTSAYKRHVLEGYAVAGSNTHPFLQFADHSQIGAMLAIRKDTAKVVLGAGVSNWITNGD